MSECAAHPLFTQHVLFLCNGKTIRVIEKHVLGERNTQPGITAKETTKGSYHSYSIKEEENGREEVKLLIAQKEHPGLDHSTLSSGSTNIPL